MSQNDDVVNIIQIKIGGTTMNITAMGIDIAKDIFQLHGVDEKGKCTFQKKLTRVKLLNYIAQLPKCLKQN